MRRILGISVMFLGTLVCIIIFNIVLCALVPPYKNAISSAVAGNSGIPVVEVTEGGTVVKENNEVRYIANEVSDREVEEYFNNLDKKEDAEELGSAGAGTEEPIVIDREYYEDCGNGKGYWVLTYSDGRKVVE